MKDRLFLLNSLKFATKYTKFIIKQTATGYGSVTKHKIDTSKTEQEHIIPLLATDLLWNDGLETTGVFSEEIQAPLKKTSFVFNHKG